MTTPTQPEPWLRGPVDGFEPLLMPVVHALIQAREDIEKLVARVPVEHTWERPGGAASIGFHVRHRGGALDRLFTYARGEALSDAQQAARLRHKPAVAHDVEAGLSKVVAPRLAARPLVDRIHRPSVTARRINSDRHKHRQTPACAGGRRGRSARCGGGSPNSVGGARVRSRTCRDGCVDGSGSRRGPGPSRFAWEDLVSSPLSTFMPSARGGPPQPPTSVIQGRRPFHSGTRYDPVDRHHGDVWAAGRTLESACSTRGGLCDPSCDR